MGAKTIFFDFDETLVDTSELRPYRRTAEGLRFIANHPDQVNTRLIDTNLLMFFNKLAKRNLSAIATNSPLKYTRALLKKHGFSNDIPIYHNLHKPYHERLSRAIKKECHQVDDALFIGDSASDILAAHGCRIPSIAVTWGNTSTPEKLKKAEPTKTVKTVKDLKSCIRSFYNVELSYKERIAPEAFLFLDDPPEDVEVKYHYLYKYYPYGHPNFYKFMSEKILRFKEIKDFLMDEVRDGAIHTFFYKGEIRRKFVLKDVFGQFYRKLTKCIDNLDLKGKSYAIAAPNSAPEYCYKSDINQIMVNNLNRKVFKIDKEYQNRIFFRVFPKRESHLNKSRNKSEHYETIGAKKTASIPNNIVNLIIFDDVSTTHTQLVCLANIIKTIFEFDGNLIGITLGQTI